MILQFWYEPSLSLRGRNKSEVYSTHVFNALATGEILCRFALLSTCTCTCSLAKMTSKLLSTGNKGEFPRGRGIVPKPAAKLPRKHVCTQIGAGQLASHEEVVVQPESGETGTLMLTV